MSQLHKDLGLEDVGEIEVREMPAAPVAAKQLDPEDDRENWPIIHIEFEEGKPNYEFLGAQGTKKDGTPFDHYLRVQRGVDVAVPPSVVNMLRLAISTHMKQVRNMQTGLNDRVFTDRSSVPWRLIRGGKYC